MKEIRKEIIAEKPEKGVQFLLLTAEMSDGRKIERYACRYKGVLLPLIRDFDTAETLYWYLIEDIDLDKHLVPFPAESKVSK